MSTAGPLCILAVALAACADDRGARPGFCDCDDGDPCTDDFCNGSKCSHLPAGVVAACEFDSHCQDDDACTVDHCVPNEACGFSRCEHVRIDSACVSCRTTLDCGTPCALTECVDGRCQFGEEDPLCDVRCFDPLAQAPGNVAFASVGSAVTLRGLAAAVGQEACDTLVCGCDEGLVLRGEDGFDMALAGDDLAAYGTCQADQCVGTERCRPLARGHGYVLWGVTLGAPPTSAAPAAHAVAVRPLQSLAVQVAGRCVSTATARMQGRWGGTFTLGDAAVVFAAAVGSSNPVGQTRFNITDAATAGAVTVSAQSFVVPDSALRLPVTIETSAGSFSGILEVGESSLSGAVLGPSGEPATLALTPVD
ncbi:MAG: hypothetical protein U1F43_29495 [Myxococcota bacterium]